ncbi:replication factor A protein 3 [Dacryopinax primogenitus]|uniref:Replication factor A protein 3 n=1 Tax=Dacryopinax primogenitus (strain DJM 731) TaxID=1858805 RepID=M5G157_DACPD|nr:replication factor A protein 3 [Dacryopinax primogenitus]EJU02469.1 replication factor A protein 3 [Dacryopinax primogenitus]
MDRPTPRINSKRMQYYVGQVVRMTGKLLRVNGDTAIIESTDGGNVEVRLSRDSHLSDPIVEIIGHVEDEHTLKMLTGSDMGSDVDLQTWDTMTELMHKFPEIFMEPDQAKPL